MRVLLAVLVSLTVASPQWPPTPSVRPPASPPGQPSTPASESQRPRVRSATGDALDRYSEGDYTGAIGGRHPLSFWKIALLVLLAVLTALVVAWLNS